MAQTVERTPLTGEQIEQGATLFAPADSDIYGKVTWVIAQMEATQGPATGVAKDIETYYELKGVKAPRGYGRASIVNAATDAKLWEVTGLGRTTVTITTDAGKTVKQGAAQLVGRIDAARHAHGGKTVKRLISETLDSLQTDVTPDVKYTAIMGALSALIDAPLPTKDETPKVVTLAQVIALLVKAQEGASTLEGTDELVALIDAAIDAGNALTPQEVPAE